MFIRTVKTLSVTTAFCTLVAVNPVFASGIAAKTYDIQDVSEVVINNAGQLKLTQGNTESLRVEATAETLARVSVDLTSHKLTLGMKNGVGGLLGWVNNHDKVTYILQLKDLRYLGVNGASNVDVGDWKGSKLDINTTGASEISFKHLTLENLFAQLSGASNTQIQQLDTTHAKFSLSGASNTEIKKESNVTTLQVGASGASDFKGEAIQAKNAEVEASGASEIIISVVDTLTANASGASHIRYKGNPKAQVKSSGASDVDAIK